MAEQPLGPSDGDGAARRAPSPFETARITDELGDGFAPKPQQYSLDPKDNLPRPVVPWAVKSAEAPPLHPDHFLCMADRSRFVLRDEAFGNVIAQFTTDEVTRTPRGQYLVPTQLAADRVPTIYRDAAAMMVLAQEKSRTEMLANMPPGADPDDFAGEVPEMTAAMIVAMAVNAIHPDPNTGLMSPPRRMRAYPLLKTNPTGWDPRARERLLTDEVCEVEPLREQCRHYARQQVDFPFDPDHRYTVRLCTARRDDEGSFVSLAATKVFACELRSPRLYESEQRLDDFDDRLVAEAEQAKQEEVFDVEAALAAEEEGNGSS